MLISKIMSFYLKITFFLFAFMFSIKVMAGRDYPCKDPTIYDLTDRGSVTDTPCIVPKNKIMVEGGYQYANLIENGNLNLVPQTQVTLGIVPTVEVFVILPSYQGQTRPTVTGSTPTFLGTKKEITHTEKWILSGQGLIAPPSGSKAFGNKNVSFILNGIMGYKVSSKVSISIMLGESGISNPYSGGGARYYSFNPSIALGLSPTNKFNLFAEMFGQTKTNAGEGGGLDFDTGVIYEVNDWLTYDFEYGTKCVGKIANIQYYLGTGLTFLLN